MSNKVRLSDIQDKLHEIKSQVDESTTQAKPAATSIGASVVAGAVGLAYLLGQRKARNRSTVVEIRRE